jgi:hypothetical protein
MAVWPWPQAVVTHPHKGVARWSDASAQDGTVVELIRFDFRANPQLRFELYDQDEDDAVPFDNHADYYPRGVGQIVKHLNEKRGEVVAAWNGPFFGYDRRPGPPQGLAVHVSPVVLAGQARYNVGSVRWAFGVKGKEFTTIHQPDMKEMQGAFDYGAGGLQCLVRDGKPLQLQPFPTVGDKPLLQPVPSTPDDAGHIPYVDHMRTSRTSMGWSKDSRYLYLLVVDAPGTETGSRLAVKYGGPVGAGWTLTDLQRFWLKLGVWGAVNNDGGSVTQFALKLPDGRYELMPPQIAAPRKRLYLGGDFAGAPAGGTLMTWYVAEVR